MRHNRIRGILGASILTAAAVFMAAPAFADSAVYDGIWNVTIITKTGNCDASARYPLTVTNGKIAGPQDISGSIGRSGNVKASIGGAFANGVLTGNSGSGKWNGASGGIPCSGHWVASKQ